MENIISEKLEIIGDAYIETDSRHYLFEKHMVISFGEIENIINSLYTDEEQEQIILDASDFYEEDNKTDAIHDEFCRILDEGVRYEFN